MVGDHKQLPAVVVQNKADTRTKNENLVQVGIVDTAMSLFERLYYRCNEMGWQHAYGVLQAQGRMHVDLMKFPNQKFYENRLVALSRIDRLTKKLESNSSLIPAQRLIYIPTETDEEFSWKTNVHEAVICKEIIDNLISGFANSENSEFSIGVITPYRAQIAMLSQKIHSDHPTVTIDTVERYQGGARDVIIISLCTNRLDQLENLVTPSLEGIDRKLNVALTRARERIFILGNEEILRSDTTYAALISACYKWEMKVEKVE
jgi:DNA replication ATP-dependent helicase Dna2